MDKFKNKVSLVTGASKGIGASIAKHLASAGAAVVVNYSSGKEGAESVVREITNDGGKAIAVRADVSNESEVAALIKETKKQFGHLDVLINNAGVYTFAPLEELSLESYRRQFDTNVFGLLVITKAAIPLFPASGGSIVNISSAVSTMAPPMASVYVGSKGAVDAITRSLAKELAGRHIRVNSINPGFIITEGLISGGIAGSPIEEQMVAMTPLGRAGQPEDVALPTLFLASDDARYITGESLYVAGGAGS